ncbi:MAG TPA: OmpH family outer membrane protein [Terriglobales bacterium]|jgi:outer membrane protein|nr:OmpH family outer membrane protein [Terriglobales bacterium]
MTRKYVPTFLLFAVVLSLAALAQTGTAAAAPGAAAPASPPAAAPAAAASLPGITKVGIINIQGAIMVSNEGRRDLDALDKKFDPKRTELQNLNKEIEDLKKQLNTQGDKMNEEARSNLVHNLETKQKQMQRSSEDAQNEYQQQQTEIAQRILQKMAPLIDKFAKDNQYSLLIDVSQPWPQGQVLWFGTNADVTKQVVDLYNAQSGVAAPATTSNSSSKPASGTTTPKSATTTHRPTTTATQPATAPKQ